MRALQHLINKKKEAKMIKNGHDFFLIVKKT